MDKSSQCLAPFKDDDCEVSDVDDNKNQVHIDENKVSYLKDIGLWNEMCKMKMAPENINHSILQGHENYNVDVPSGRQKFMDHFREIIWQRRVKKNHNVDPSDDLKAEFDIDEGDDKEMGKIKSRKLEMLQVNTSKGVLKEYSQQMIDDIDLTIEPERQASFYHYKRWIWIIFPWLCMSIDSNCSFSDVIAKCYSSATKYMSVKEEREFTGAALKIAFSAPYSGPPTANIKKNIHIDQKHIEGSSKGPCRKS